MAVIEIPITRSTTDVINQPNFSAVPFRRTEELFPNWKKARMELMMFLADTGDWDREPMLWNGRAREFERLSPSDIYYSLKFPKITVAGGVIPMYETFPEEYKALVVYICTSTMWNYSPNFGKYIMWKVGSDSHQMILNDIKCREQDIIETGGRNIKDELAFRLGLVF